MWRVGANAAVDEEITSTTASATTIASFSILTNWIDYSGSVPSVAGTADNVVRAMDGNDVMS